MSQKSGLSAVPPANPRQRKTGSWLKVTGECVGFLLLAAIGLKAGQWYAKAGQPVLFVAQPIHDFGSSPALSEVQHRFVLENKGHQPLKVIHIEATCGCIKEAEMMESRTIAPGQKGNLRITMETPGRAENVQQSIIVRTNDPTAPEKTLTIKAFIRPVIDVQPGVFNFGVVEQTVLPVEEHNTATTFSNPSNSTKRQVKAQSDAPYLQAQAVRSNEKEWDLKLTLLKNAPIGPVMGTVTIKPDWAPPQKILVLGQVIGDIYAEPGEIFIALPEPRDLETKLSSSVKLQVISRGERVTSVKVLSISANLQKIMRFTQPDKEGILQVTVVHAPSLSKGHPLKGTMLLQVGLADKSLKQLVVPVILERNI